MTADEAAGRGMARAIRVKARAVILHGDALVVTRERRGTQALFMLPGGRVKPRESAEHAAIREVREETGLQVTIGRLLYVAEVIDHHRAHDLNLVFLAGLAGEPTGVELLALDRLDEVDPPVLTTLAADRAGGWTETPRWLGDVRRPRQP